VRDSFEIAENAEDDAEKVEHFAFLSV